VPKISSNTATPMIAGNATTALPVYHNGTAHLLLHSYVTNMTQFTLTKLKMFLKSMKSIKAVKIMIIKASRTL